MRTTPVSQQQRQEILALLSNGLDNQAIAAEVGVSAGQVAAIKAHVTMGTYSAGNGGDDTPDAEGEVLSAVDGMGFALERDMERALRDNIEQLEARLTITDGGRQHVVPSGKIDITASDERGAIVVIELKADTADREAIGQILSYIGDVSVSAPQVRGILVAREFTPRAVAAARASPSIRLVRYGYHFTFEPVASGSQTTQPKAAEDAKAEDIVAQS